MESDSQGTCIRTLEQSHTICNVIMTALKNKFEIYIAIKVVLKLNQFYALQ